MYYFCHFYKNDHFFPGRLCREILSVFTNFDLFFCCVTSSTRGNAQKWGCMCTLTTEGEGDLLCMKNFSKILHTFCKILYQHVCWYNIAFLVFLHKCSTFVGRFSWENEPLSQIFGCFVVVKRQLLIVTNENMGIYDTDSTGNIPPQ